MAPLSTRARPVAVLAAGLLLAGAVQAGPASAAPVDTGGLAVSISVAPEHVDTSPYPGGGDSPDVPANLGRMPGSVGMRVVVTNSGTEPLHAVALSNRVLANGATSAPDCAHVVLTPPDEPQPAPVDDLVLQPGQSVLCGYQVSGVLDQVVHEDVTTATVRGEVSGGSASSEAHFYAVAQDDAARLGDRVWLDRNGNGVQDAGEPGIAGVRLTLNGPDGAPVPDAYDPSRTIAPQVTGPDGTYLFTHLTPTSGDGLSTVTVDPTSTSLRGLEPTLAGVGASDTDSSTGSASASTSIDAYGKTDVTLDFGFVAPVTPPVTPPAPTKASVSLTADASPGTAVKGTAITVKGSVRRDGKAFATTTALEFRGDASSAWTKVKNVTSSGQGALSASVTASSSGSFRYRFAGSRTTEAGTSRADHVVVRKASVRLTVNAPGSVTKGKSIAIKGSVRREGKKYRTTTVLELRVDDAGAWTKVETVRSSSGGALSIEVKPTRSGSYRYRYAGNSTTEAGASPADHVTVKPKPKPKPKPKAYKNCTALHTVYPHGVGRSGAKDHGGHVSDFVRDTKTYNLNTKSDRDKDGIACEKS